VSVVTDADLALVPPAPLDDALRAVPGFSLFRRTSSRSANPTTQGAGLRGLAASGASRALVLADGEPLNDPFGGWVYWNRVPQMAIERVEVVRGGASDLYGADALAGVLQVITARPSTFSGRGEVSAASRETGRISLFAGGSRGRLSATGGAEGSTTDGYVLVSEAERGAIDTPAGGRYGTARADVTYTADAFFVRAGGDLFGERRDNGTVLQTNSTDLRQVRFAAGGQVGRVLWRLNGQAGSQTYRQVFSAIADDRQSERLVLQQRVPASQHGLAFTLHTSVRGIDLLAGADTRDTSADNIEQGYQFNGQPRPLVTTPGFGRTSGVFVQASAEPATNVRVTAGIRGDARALTRDEGLFGDDSAWSPRAALAWSPAPWATVHASLGWSFRAPTLNERFRGFRVGDVQTLPNADLEPETLRTVEGSLLVRDGRGSARVTIFRNDLTNAVTNVTLETTPSLITRRRENVGGVRVWGAEVEGEWRLNARATLTGTLALLDSVFAEYPPLEGLRVPQVPRWHTALGLRGAGPFGLVLASQIRAFGRQFENDQNTLTLGRGLVVDATVIRPVGRRLSLFASLENLFDDQYEVGRTPVATYGQPFTAHAGVRVALP
jgi:outer membrane receptor protein involved in Fe transport